MKKEGGKKGIKILILLLVLVVPVLITFVVLRLNLDSDLRKGSVSSLTLIYGEQEKTVEKREELEFFISLAESGETIAETANPLSDYRKCEAVFHKLNRDVTYLFYLSDSVNNCVYTDPDGALFLIPEEEAAKLLAHPLVTGYAVSYASYPTLEFTQGGETYGARKVEGNWTYAKTNETKSYKDVSEKNEEKVILPQGEQLNFKFSLEPDFCSISLQNEKGEILFSGDPKEMKLLALETDTPLTLVAKCDWYQDEHEEYFGTLTYFYDVFYDVPSLCSIDRQTVSPGESIVLTVEHSSSETIAAVPSFSTEKITQEKVDGVWTITVPVSPTATAGDYDIMLMGSDVEETYTVTIREAN
ncbi:MAG: hypothetical protein IJC26_03760 [Clostridia bacterium]|nr:hypothetical protein [Clostridia bacterium]